jgi:hypothetical protein
MLIRGGGLLWERGGTFEKLFQGDADFHDQEEQMKRPGSELGSWEALGAAGLCQRTNIALPPT